MTMVVIRQDSGNKMRYRAVAGEKESFGSTMGEALDALAENLYESEEEAVVLVQDFQPDEFFNEDQQRRLSYLMGKWRAARDSGQDFSPSEQQELETLIETELDAAGRRAEQLAGHVRR